MSCRKMIVAGALAALCITAAGFGQDSRQWNRKIDGVCVMPATPMAVTWTTDQNNVPGRYVLDTHRTWMDVQVVFSTETWGRAADWYMIGRLDLSTEVCFFLNGEKVDTQAFDTSPVLWTGSETSLDSQYVSQPVRVLMAPFDELEVVLAPAPGSARELMDEDSIKTMTYIGNPIFWDRQVGHMHFEPGPRPGIVNVDVTVGLAANYDGWLDLSTDVELLVNGEPVNMPVAQNRPWSMRERMENVWFIQCMQCNWACAYDGPGGRDVGYCQDGLPECVIEEFNQFRFVGIAANPGDTVEVILVPMQGSVPEMGTMTTFDTMTRTVPNFWPSAGKPNPRETDFR